MKLNVYHDHQGRRKGNFQRGARSASFQIFFSNMAPNKSISGFGGGAPVCKGGAADHFGIITYLLGDILIPILIQSINDDWIKKNILKTCKM